MQVKAAGFVSEQIVARLSGVRCVKRLAPVLPVLSRKGMSVPFATCAEMLRFDAGRNTPLWQLAIEYEMARGNLTETEALAKMVEIVRILRSSIRLGIAGTQYADRILGHQSGVFRSMMDAGQLLAGGVLNRAILYVTALLEVKSAMGTIVAAPTAGACAALPGACLAVAEELGLPDEAIARAMLAAGLIGVFIASQWTFAAEVGGCQAEGGAAACMAAAALTTLADGGLGQAVAAASMAMQNMLGLICDPARGKAGSIGYEPENTREEYIELYNRSTSTTNLAGWQIDNWWFALEPVKRITSLIRVGSVATATMTGHGYVEGDSVMITGAQQPEYNGVFIISNATANTFEFVISGAPAATATGTITAQKGPRLVSSITRDEWTATVVMPNHGFVEGDAILISGAGEEPYNGVFTIADVTANTFTYQLGSLPPAAATGSIVAQKASRTLPSAAIAGQGYLVIAADVASFRAKYALVANVVAGWTPKLANNGEQITLRDVAGEIVDRVKYSNEGDWGIRTRGEQRVINLTRNGNSVTITVPYHGYTIADRAEDTVYRIAGADQAEFNGEWTVTAVTRDTMTFTIPGASAVATGTITVRKKDAGHYGWEWYSPADGGGMSLELINAAMSNNNGQNWGASTIIGGTPGAANSIRAADIAPLISNVTHFPVIPRSTDPVFVTAKIVDELAYGIQA